MSRVVVCLTPELKDFLSESFLASLKHQIAELSCREVIVSIGETKPNVEVTFFDFEIDIIDADDIMHLAAEVCREELPHLDPLKKIIVTMKDSVLKLED